MLCEWIALQNNYKIFREHFPDLLKCLIRSCYRLLRTPTFSARTSASHALLIIKILKGQMDSEYRETLASLVNSDLYSLKNRNFIAFDRRLIVQGSLLHICSDALNHLDINFSIEEEFTAIKNKLFFSSVIAKPPCGFVDNEENDFYSMILGVSSFHAKLRFNYSISNLSTVWMKLRCNFFKNYSSKKGKRISVESCL